MSPLASSPRAEYKRRMHQRQTVVFGSIGAIMTILLVLCTLFWLNIVPFPFKKEFARAPEPVTYTPCIDDGAQPLKDLSTIALRVYNASEINGLAGKVSAALTEAGVSVSETTNWAGDPINNSAVIYTSKGGVTTAYTLRAFVPQAQVIYDPTLVAEQVDLVLGEKWDEKTDLVSSPSDENYAAAMQSIQECTPIKDIPEDTSKS